MQWMGQVFRLLVEGRPDDMLWPFTYNDLVKQWNIAVKAVGLPIRQVGKEELLKTLVPHQLRHGGASWDRMKGYRSLADVQKRGRWKTTKSVAIYEKHSRVTATLQAYPESQQRHFELCDERLEDVIVHGASLVYPLRR